MSIAFTAQHNSYLSYRHSFRAPGVGHLFRPGTTQGTDQLKPVNAKSVELGFRGELNSCLRYEVALYDMTIKDDIVSFVNGLSTRIAVLI